MRDVIDFLSGGKPLLMLPVVPERSAPWLQAYTVEGFVLSDGAATLRVGAHAAPFIANALPSLTVLSIGKDVLQWFDLHAKTRPALYVDLQALIHVAGSIGQLPDVPWSNVHWRYADAPDELYLKVYAYAETLRALFKSDEGKPFQTYADQYVKAYALLSLMEGRGYPVGDALAVHRSEDGLVHPTWMLPAVPGRITTKAPPFHAMANRHWDAMRAAPGHRWLRIAWPGAVTRIAKTVTLQALGAVHPDLRTAIETIPDGSNDTDWVLGAHHVKEPNALPAEVENLTLALREAWHNTRRPYLFMVPGTDLTVDGSEALTYGKMALMATSAFTVANLSVLGDAFTLLRHRALTGLHSVIPGLGSLTCQIDDRVPLPVVHEYVQMFHAHHVQPVVTLGTHWGSMVPLDHPFADVALQLERPTVTPVQCPLCLGTADSERDLATHFVEDHGYVQ